MFTEKVYVVAPDSFGVARMWRTGGYEVTENPDDAGIICFTGGADIDPSLYHCSAHPSTYFSSARDHQELPYWQQNKAPTKLKVGICRGAQLLCAMNHGILYQDVNNHSNGPHEVLYFSDQGTESRTVSSVHHQMMRPHPRSNHEVWAYAARSTYRDIDSKIDPGHRATNWQEGYDTEIMYYPDTASYCFQGHPEFGPADCTLLFHQSVRRAIERQTQMAQLMASGYQLPVRRLGKFDLAIFTSPYDLAGNLAGRSVVDLDIPVEEDF